jgi:curved DNA-binding protein CbpA
MEFKNYYHILGVKQDATKKEIKTAYRKLAMKYHPDKNDGDDTFWAEKYKDVNEAYRILYNPKEREIFDQKLLRYEGLSNNEPISKKQNYFIELLSVCELYFVKEKQLAQKKEYLAYLKEQKKENFLKPQKLLWLTFFIAVLYYALPLSEKPISKYFNHPGFSLHYGWEVTESTMVFSEPDIQSDILGRVPKGYRIEVINETKYFLLHRYTDKEGVTQDGYILKTKTDRKFKLVGFGLD